MINIKLVFFRLWKLWMWLCTLMVTGILVALVGLLLIDPFFFQIDSCMDAGGVWNYDASECEGA